MAKTTTTTTANKVNWGVLKDAKHAKVLQTIAEWKAIRDKMAQDQENRKQEVIALREQKEFKGKVIDDKFTCDNPKVQTEYNLAESKIAERYKELARKRREDLGKVYSALFRKELFAAYTEYMAADSGDGAKSKYLEEMEIFLKTGLAVPFGDKGLRYASVELVKGIGKQILGVRQAYKRDQDAVLYKENRFYDAVMANLRSILQEKNVIACTPIETPKEKKAKKEKAKEQPAQPVKVEDAIEIMAEAKKKTPVRNRGTKAKAQKPTPKVKEVLVADMAALPFA